MRIQFHEVVGFLILGLLLLAGIYGQIIDLHHVQEQPGDMGVQALMLGPRVVLEDHIINTKGVESVTIAYLSDSENKASTVEW